MNVKHKLIRNGLTDKLFINDMFVESAPIKTHAEISATIIAKREMSLEEIRLYFLSEDKLIFMGVHCFLYRGGIINFKNKSSDNWGNWLFVEEEYILDILDKIASKWGSKDVKGKDVIFLKNLLNSYATQQEP